ncbi:MAG TPA: MATE family efflux transporter [Dehalococcoidia bacterium]|nr:MATE family efflux transporter [Dehalococcoidia bacterium]
MDRRRASALDDDRVGRLMLRLSAPAFFGMFVMTLYNVIDTIFIGHYVGPLGIAGLSIVFPFQMLSMGLGQMFGMGGASVISRLIGSGDVPRAERALGNAITSIVVLSAILTIAGLSNANFWLRLMGASENILPYARDYMTIILIGTVLRTLAMASNALIRSEGNARVPMIGMIMGAVANIILDAIFIIPLDMGIKGAALATVLAQLLPTAYFIRYFFSGKSYLKIHLQNLILEFSIMRAILAIGVASFARTVATSLSAIFVNRVLVSYGGDLAVSAYGVINRIMMFAMMPGMVTGQGLQPVLGFNYGAKHYDRALRAMKLAFIASTGLCLISFMVLYFAPEPIIRIFTNDSELIALASHAAKRIFLALYLMGFIMVGSLIFQSVGKATQSFVTAISRPFLFLIPLIFTLPRYLDVDGVWLAFPISDGLTFILTVILLIPQIRELRKADVSAILQ